MAKLPTLKPRLQTLKTSQPISNVTANKRNRGRSWRKLRLEVLLRDGYTCQHCGLVSMSLEVDHTIPLFRGGSDELDNLKSLCVDCHKVKTIYDSKCQGAILSSGAFDSGYHAPSHSQKNFPF